MMHYANPRSTRPLPVAAAIALLAGGASSPLRAADDPAVLDEVIARFNRGISLMERHEAPKAVDEFKKVVELRPDWIVGRINLGIAYLNTQKEPDLPRAEETFREVLRIDPRNPWAHYSLAMLHLHHGKLADAEAELGKTLE